MTKVSESIGLFLSKRATPANQDLVDRYHAGCETQVNVIRGEPVEGRRNTYTDGEYQYWNLRIPKKADTEPVWRDYEMSWPFDLFAEGIGCTGWDWNKKKSLWVGFDVDSITGHAAGTGITDEELETVKEKAEALPYVEVRKSTGGKGLHFYVHFDGIPTENHTIHSALARCVLSMMSSATGFDFASQVDVCGGNMWIWHRKANKENGGLSLIKAATQVLTAKDLPSNWRDEPPKKKSETSPKPKHPVDDDFNRAPDWEVLFGPHGYTVDGDTVKRPGTDKASSGSIIHAKDSTPIFHVFSTNTEHFEAEKNYNAITVYAILNHNGNIEAARADLAKQGYGRMQIPLITSKELDGTLYKLVYLIRGILLGFQPCIVAGPKKALKTSLLIALAIALATGLRFLGHFIVDEPVKVVILSGESGMAVLQETARRICQSMGICLSTIDNLLWSDCFPRFDDPQHLAALERMLRETGCKVLIIDPAYLAMPGTDAANLFVQGTLLRQISEVCQRNGVGLILAHHTQEKGKGTKSRRPRTART